ncbi:hypothetical protein GGF32_002658 [Allomyces javanicus]|nr:hypothetical protein GGF32_002658 [Allomyces javanicus]
MDNIEALTRGARVWKSKRKQKAQDLEIKWDDDARKDYLTGFHKRKVELKKKRVEYAKLRERKERNEHRAEKRRALAEFARRMEQERQGGLTNPSLSDDEDSHDADAKAAKAAAAVAEYANDQMHTTVTVSEMSIGPDDGYFADLSTLSKTMLAATEAAVSPSNDEDEEMGDAEVDDADALPARKKPKKKVFKYETKKERQTERKRQLDKVRKGEARSGLKGTARKPAFKKAGGKGGKGRK